MLYICIKALDIHKSMGFRHCLHHMCMVRLRITNSTHARVTFDMYAKLDSHKDHEKEAHTAKSLGKSLLHCTIKTQASTNKAQKAMNAKIIHKALMHSSIGRSSRLHQSKIHIWSKEHQPTSTNIKEGQRGATTQEKISIGKSK